MCMLPMVYTIIVIIFVLFLCRFFCNFVIFFCFFFCFKLRNDFNLLFVACHNNRSFLTTKEIDEHGISAKKTKTTSEKSGVIILL